MKTLALFLSFLLPCTLFAEDNYHIRHLSERELVQTYDSLLLDAWHHADKFWHDWPVEPGAGYWGPGRVEGDGVRNIAAMVLTSASLLKYSEALDQNDRNEIRRKAVAAIRYCVATHTTGSQTCVGGKKWGNSWQSAMWTGDLAFGAWLMWDDLDAATQKDLRRVITFESDRFLSIKPPTGEYNDTKAEENGWDLTCIGLAAAMFPDEPHAAAWNQKAIEYAMNTLSAPQDAQDNTVVDGRPVSQWFCGANVHSDFTLENHGIFHPSYVGCSSYFLTGTAMYYTFGHRAVPQATMHHLMDEWKMYQGIILPNGEAAYPQGMDWELHGLPYVTLFAALACREHDPLAAHLENVYVQYLRQWQVKSHGDLELWGCPFGFGRHATTTGLVAYAFLAHKIFGPAAKEMSARKAVAAVEGVHLYDRVQVAIQRTANKFASFSWTNRVMGMVIPIGAGHEGNPDFTAPIQNGFIGGFDPAPKGYRMPSVAEHSWKQTPDGFETTGTLLVNGGSLKQTLRMSSIGEKTVVYEDRVTATRDVAIEQEHGVPIGIENDEITGGARQLFWQDGHTLLDFKKPQPALAISGAWANVDGRLGLIMVAGGNLSYNQAKSYARGISIYEDVLYGSYSTQPKQFKAGDEVAHHVAIVLLETSPKETAALAKSFKLEDRPAGKVLRFKPPGSREIELRLL
ncbi:MAG TPA: hypothetical protein VFB72_20215 [Verrucomicrobiae bacterium]|nr:hypothetical protein [Verrucomicrobiae bacterium]